MILFCYYIHGLSLSSSVDCLCGICTATVCIKKEALFWELVISRCEKGHGKAIRFAVTGMHFSLYLCNRLLFVSVRAILLVQRAVASKFPRICEC